MGSLPLFTDPAFGLTALAPLFTAASEAFNGGLLELIQTFNRFSHKRQQIFLLDMSAIFKEVTAQLKAEGKDTTGHTITTFPGGGYLETGLQPGHLEFYDQVHPNSYAWHLVSKYTSAYFDTLNNGPRFAAAEQDLVFAASSAHRNAVQNHFRTLHAQRYVYSDNWEECGFCEGDRIQLYADYVGKWGSTATRSTAFGLNFNTQLGLLGIDYSPNPCMTIGCSFTGQGSCAQVKRCAGHMRLNEFIPTLYAFLAQEDYFIDVSTSYHFLNFKKLHRRIPFIDRKAKSHTEGQAYECTADLGYVSQCGSLTLIPIIGIEFENICIRSLKEKGAGFLDLKMRRQHQNSLMSKLGAQFFWNGWGSCLTPFAEIYYEYEFMRTRHTIGPRIFRSKDGSINYARVGCGRRNFLQYSVGIDLVLTECMSGNISYYGDTTFKNCNNAIRVQLDAAF